MRQMTDAGYDFLEQEEGERLAAYDDATGRPVPAGGRARGTLTIGVGHTGPDVYPGQVITNEESRRLFDADTDWAEECVETTCPGANDNEFNAMVSLCFNIGAAAFKGSTVARMWKAGNRKAAGNAFAPWNKWTNPDTRQLEVHPVLAARRAREMAVFFTPMPSEVPKPMPQSVAPPVSTASSKTVIAGTVSVAAGAASVADQIDQITPIVTSITTAGASFQNLLKLGGLAVSIIALGAVAFMLWRYVAKKRRGEVVST